MKVGILILFCNSEKEIIEYEMAKLFNVKSDSEICFINNGSKDNTLRALKVIRDDAKIDISILDIKKNKGINAAVKAGARYLFSRTDIDYIVYMRPNMLSYFKALKTQIKLGTDLFKNRKKSRILRDIFSIDEILSFKKHIVL
ncbi:MULTISPECIES: glycosyltransferase [unclassified Tenacibaculum]|uniref:glycosyltransferase n=1 Tax=Tenacibaculum TaxID=104267 RepID=UPI001F30D1F6|nr:MULTISPECIES: glycosyltransferase [unclassified Tenacibaculum]MCF2875177.1 glycosyltransferase [Tenacibaculum sp. Cn5-1]MCF2935253.1 glycosyltransferase [Tenacibaculum sp. Cn5-34]MCG7511305.1 glycosyltransferase [Tenacibaculum sp. Cn5-46]